MRRPVRDWERANQGRTLDVDRRVSARGIDGFGRRDRAVSGRWSPVGVALGILTFAVSGWVGLVALGVIGRL
jgi:hypothetical protein